MRKTLGSLKKGSVHHADLKNQLNEQLNAVGEDEEQEDTATRYVPNRTMIRRAVRVGSKNKPHARLGRLKRRMTKASIHTHVSIPLRRKDGTIHRVIVRREQVEGLRV